MLDKFSERYTDFLDGLYDSADRIVLNAYFSLGHSAGGFRTWWRRLHGSDDDLDKTHLMRMAGRFSRRLHAYAKAHQIPMIDCPSGERKHPIAEEHLPTDPNFVGLFLILVGRAPAPVWQVQKTTTGKIQLSLKKPYTYVNHYFFHILDPEWGHVIIRMSGHPPFPASIILNGHEYIARQAQHAGIPFQKEGNCFTAIANASQLARIADTLCAPHAIGQLEQVCERWLYSTCLHFALSEDEQKKSGFCYAYSVYQMEYSRNLLFTHGGQMEQVFQSMVDRTRTKLDIKRLKTILGVKKRPFRHKKKGQPPPRLEVVVERPVYDLTIFKIHLGKFTLKLYTKGEHVLRCEVVIHNARALSCGYSLPRFPQIVAYLKDLLERFLNQLDGIDNCFIADDTLDTLSTPSYIGQTRLAGIDLNKPRMRAVLEAVIALSVCPRGFTASALATKVCSILGLTQEEYKPRHAAYDLKKLRGKNWVRHSSARRYETVPEGLQTMAALLVLREKIIKPVLAGAGRPQPGRPKLEAPLDAQYRTLQVEMRNLFRLLGLTVQD